MIDAPLPLYFTWQVEHPIWWEDCPFPSTFFILCPTALCVIHTQSGERLLLLDIYIYYHSRFGINLWWSTSMDKLTWSETNNYQPFMKLINYSSVRGQKPGGLRKEKQRLVIRFHNYRGLWRRTIDVWCLICRETDTCWASIDADLLPPKGSFVQPNY